MRKWLLVLKLLVGGHLSLVVGGCGRTLERIHGGAVPYLMRW